ncbi:D-alanyl-D-alanine carboxypeptidase [Klebsiella sp. SORGH_AS 1173]|nr:D-alanyl-D-alanine carboxypeptidase [Klebsiella sp. SORGH_AS_1173]
MLASSVSCAFAVDFPATVAPPAIQAGSWVLMDYTTGQVLTAGNEHQQRNPASLTKLMTGYVVDRAPSTAIVSPLTTSSPWVKTPGRRATRCSTGHP